MSTFYVNNAVIHIQISTVMRWFIKLCNARIGINKSIFFHVVMNVRLHGKSPRLSVKKKIANKEKMCFSKRDFKHAGRFGYTSKKKWRGCVITVYRRIN